MDKKDLDWGNLGFAYQPTDYSYVSNYKDGAWDEGALTADHSLRLSECAGIFHYCQEVFEGLKAYTAQNGDIVCFRPDQNAERMYNSAQRLVMPPFPRERFIEAVEQVVRANAAWVPPFGSGATLYIRPFMVATGNVIGVRPADEYQFRILVTPVGPYYSGGVKPVKLQVSKYDRAAPHGTGNIKAGLNYAMSLLPSVEAHAKGYADNLFLDPKTRSFVEESGGANILFVRKDGTLVVPQSHTDSILPSVTRRSLVDVAKKMLGMTIEQRPVMFEEVDQFVECGMCGTAAVISPVGEIDADDRQIVYGMEHVGPVMRELRETLTGIQVGEIADQFGWVHKITLG
ncbi:branched-chain amino acid aminotransferase [Olsenella sp. oral taxon 807]|jgi:branched-chain-amino-acid transaminase|uniref:branched-chain amino acid aminotransferase n=1 Tax=Olsenella sp. oral taxon 807 TaxID=712411 RepID=UPI000679FF4F|nr:branched-chain amino acid aminotransferase [Olsenella sp. oral taxon 807]AKT48287.1 branched-chain amino acid aminotransferase [Olsenella sp. oral taxon 807]